MGSLKDIGDSGIWVSKMLLLEAAEVCTLHIICKRLAEYSGFQQGLFR